MCIISHYTQSLLYQLGKKTFQVKHGHRWNRQCAQKVMSNSPELVDVAIGLVIFVLNCWASAEHFLGKLKLQKD